MTDGPNDYMEEARDHDLGLSGDDFKQFLIDEGYATEKELIANPQFAVNMINRIEVYNSYIETRMSDFLTKTNNQTERLKHG